MSTVSERAVGNARDILSLLILGAGFVALFGGGEYFFLIWIIGFAVVLPIVAILSGNPTAATMTCCTGDVSAFEVDKHDDANRTTSDTLETLRDRYARGELTDEQFERKLDHLLETESVEETAESRSRSRSSPREREWS
jgi:uncharacterized membrane protein